MIGIIITHDLKELKKGHYIQGKLVYGGVNPSKATR